MRQTAARLNRAWLTVIGVVLLLAGLAAVAISLGLLAPAAKMARLAVAHPAPSDTVFTAGVASVLDQVWTVVLIVVVGVVLALLGLGWLTAQIPRSNQAKPFRLHDSAEAGLTRCAPSVLTDTVESQVTALPGVHAAAAVMRGTAESPELTLRVTAADRTDIPRLLATLQNRVAGDLGAALDTRLQRLAVQIEIDTAKTKTNHITL